MPTPTPGRFVAFTKDYTPAIVDPGPPVPGPDGLIDPPKITPAGDPVISAPGVVEQGVFLPVIDVTKMRLILAGYAVVTPYQHPDLADADALIAGANLVGPGRYPSASYGLSTYTDGYGGQPLVYAMAGVAPGPFSIGFVQDNAVPPDETPPDETGVVAAPPEPVVALPVLPVSDPLPPAIAGPPPPPPVV